MSIEVSKVTDTLIHKIHYQGTGQIARLIAFFPSCFVFKNENVKVKVKYGFVLQDPPYTLELLPPT